MRKALITSALLASLVGLTAHAQDAAPAADPASNSNPGANGGWSGTGEFGFASARGNSRTENVNAKLGLNQENELWKNNFFLNAVLSLKHRPALPQATPALCVSFTPTALPGE